MSYSIDTYGNRIPLTSTRYVYHRDLRYESRDCKMLKKYFWAKETNDEHAKQYPKDSILLNKYRNYVTSEGVPFKSMSKDDLLTMLKTCTD